MNHSRLRWNQLALALILSLGVIGFLARMGQLWRNAPVIGAWPDQDEQYRLSLEGAPADALLAADAILPETATILLVTSGEDVRHLEYTTFHRALYFLAPRPVWWISPAPSDGTWESRWWQVSPLTAEAVLDVIEARGAHCVMTLGVRRPGDVGEEVARWGETTLLQVAGHSDNCAGPKQLRPNNVFDVGFGWPVTLFIGLVGAWSIGLGIVVLAGRWGFHLHRLEGFALSWTLGAGILSVGLLWLNLLGLSPAVQKTAVSLAAAAVLAASWRSWPRRTGREAAIKQGADLARDGWGAALKIFLLTLLLLNALFVLLMVSGRPLTVWDSWVNWAMKARIIFRQGGITPVLYADPSRAVALLDYPLFIPLLEAWIFGWLGAPDDRLLGLLFWLFYLSLPLIIYGTGRRWGVSATTSILAATVVAAMGPFVGLAASAFTDLVLAVMVTVAAIYLVDWLSGSGRGALFIGALAGGLLPWVKREGLILLILLGIGAIGATLMAGMLGRSRPTWRRATAAIASYALAALVLAGPWWLFAGREAIASANFLSLDIITFLQNFGRLPAIGYLMAGQLLQPEFGAIWLLVLLSLFFVFRNGPLNNAAPLLMPIVALLYPALMGLAYVFSDYVPYQQHVLASAFRLGAQVAPLLVVWLAYGSAIRRQDLQAP